MTSLLPQQVPRSRPRSAALAGEEGTPPLKKPRESLWSRHPLHRPRSAGVHSIITDQWQPSQIQPPAKISPTLASLIRPPRRLQMAAAELSHWPVPLAEGEHNRGNRSWVFRSFFSGGPFLLFFNPIPISKDGDSFARPFLSLRESKNWEI